MAEDKKILENETMNEEELEQVAGGTRAEFEEICKALGKSATWNTRDGIRDHLKKNFGINVEHWNTGDRGSKVNGPAEFSARTSDDYLMNLSFDNVKAIIKGETTVDQLYEDYYDRISVYE